MTLRRRGHTAAVLSALLLGPVNTLAQPARPSAAQGTPSGVQLTTQVSSRDVEVGERIVVSITALSSKGGASPSNPQLAVDGKVEINGPGLRTEFRMFSDGRSFERQQGLTATWTVIPLEEGTLTIGPGTFQIGGSRVSGERVIVKVRPASGTPRRSPPSGMSRGRSWPDPLDFDPLDWFRRRHPPGMDPDRDPFADLLEPRVPAELRVDRAPDPIGFARLDVVPKQVVVGEQVNLKIFAYGGRGPYSVGFAAQPSTADFLSFPIEDHDIASHRVPIGDHAFHAAKIREVALIPLEVGELTIGAVELLLNGRGYPATGPQGAFLAKSQPVSVRVVEPPLAGRPPGYVIGDVGRYTLDATVEPRTVRQGDFVSVVAHLKGVGNVPSRLRPAEHQALEWLEPSVSGTVEAQGSTVGGERVFRWTVRVKQAGTIDLGALRLPYYDAERRRYETASANLGTIEVLGNASAGSDESASESTTGNEDDQPLVPRSSLGPLAQAQSPWTDRRFFWWALLGAPLSLPILGLIDRSLQALWARRRKHASTAKPRIEALLTDAARRKKEGDLDGAAAAYERALHEAIELTTGVKSRGVLREQLASTLEKQKLPREASEEVTAVIGELESFRFTRQGDGHALTERAERIAKTLLRRGPHRRAA